MSLFMKLRQLLSGLFESIDAALSVGVAGQPGSSTANRTASSDGQAAANTATSIGFAVGASGGDIVDAAKLQYVLSCVVPSEQRPTSEQIGQAVGMMGGGLSEAMIIEQLSEAE